MLVYSIPGFEDPFSSLSHLIAAFCFLCLTVHLLWSFRIQKKYSFPIFIFGFSCVFLFSMSGVYHLLPTGSIARYVLRILDYAGIYLLIAGTFTAVHGILFRGFIGWGVILIVWLLAINGITLGSIFFGSIPEYLTLIFFLGLGWLGIVSGIALWKRQGLRFIKYFVLGGLAYTTGAILEFLQQPIIVHGVIGPHELFHFMVILGTTFHWVFIIKSIKVIDQAAANKNVLEQKVKIGMEGTNGKQTHDTITSIDAGEQITYLTSLINEGKSNANNVCVINHIPQQMELVRVKALGEYWYDAQKKTVVFAPVSLAPGDQHQYFITCRALRMGSAKNIAKIYCTS